MNIPKVMHNAKTGVVLGLEQVPKCHWQQNHLMECIQLPIRL